jgi:outer membrane protein OmpA-like peptidoglycan-associated protein
MFKLTTIILLTALVTSISALPAKAEDAIAPRGEAHTAHIEAKTTEAKATDDAVVHREREAWHIAQIHFTFDNDHLSRVERRQVARIAPMLLKAVADGASVVVHGHSDALGTDAYNLDLSRRRALRVKQHLVHEWGIQPSRIHVRAWGADQPQAGTAATDALNRRVEIVLLDVAPVGLLRHDEARLAHRHAGGRLHDGCRHHDRQVLDLDDFGVSMTRSWIGRNCRRGD